MNRTAARRPVTMALWRCVAVAGLPTALAAGAALALARAWPVVVEPDAAATAQAPWLWLPLLTAAGCCLAAAIRLWPPFAEQRPGNDWLRRWQRGPLRGLGAVIAGALLAQLLLTMPLTTLLARALGAPDDVYASLHPRLPNLPTLREVGERCQATLADAVPLRELRLRPRAGPPGSPFVPSHVELRLDGERVADLVPQFEQDRQLVILPLHGRPVRGIELRLAAGTVPLWFDEDSIECLVATPRSWLVNGAAAAVLALLPTLLALALAALVGGIATAPTVAMVAGSSLFVLTIGAIGPFDPAVDAVLRGRWLPGSGTFGAVVPFLAVACVAMIGRMLLLRRPTR